MPCLAAPVIPTPTFPGLSLPAVSVSTTTPQLGAGIPCCTFQLPIIGVSITLPPLGITAAALLDVLQTEIAALNAFLRELTLDCPF